VEYANILKNKSTLLISGQQISRTVHTIVKITHNMSPPSIVRHQMEGFSRVSLVSRVSRVRIRVNVRIRVRFSFSDANTNRKMLGD